MSKQPRRKNNAQSASSGRAADLLARAEGNALGFLAHGANNPFEAATAAFSESPATSNAVELDSEVALVLKKLVKKDPLTREKALRELLEASDNREPAVLLEIFRYFAASSDKLILDGSAPVRAYALRALSFYVSGLRKTAQKYLKQIAPFVIFAQSDPSGSVAQRAEKFISENFPAEKRDQFINIFGPEAARISGEFLRKEHALNEAQRYDVEEEAEQRYSRLVAQSLNTLAMLQKSENNSAAELISQLFSDAATVKLVMKSPDHVKIGFLRLALSGGDQVQQILIQSALSAWVIQNLDSADATNCQTCFNTFLKIVSLPEFFEKFNLIKGVLPRLLTVVRKKDLHWRHCGPLFLPALSIVYEALPAEGEERDGFLRRFIDSFFDNLPFEVSSLQSFWASALVECMKFTLTRPGLQQQTYDTVMNALTKAVEVLATDSEENSQPLTDFIRWLVVKDGLPKKMVETVIDTIGLNLANTNKPIDGFLKNLLVEPQEQLLPIVVSVLSGPCPSKPTVLSAINGNYSDYLMAINEQLSLAAVIGRLGATIPTAHLEAIAELSIRLITLDKFEQQLGGSPLTDRIIATAPDDIWAKVEPIVLAGENKTKILEDFSHANADPAKLNTVIRILAMMEPAEKKKYFDAYLAEKLPLTPANLLLVIVICEKIRLSLAHASEMADLVLGQVCAMQLADAQIESVVGFLTANLPSSQSLKAAWERLTREASYDQVRNTAMLLTRLCSENEYYTAILPDQNELTRFLESLDSFTFPIALAELAVMPSTSNCCKENSLSWPELRKIFSKKALLSLKVGTPTLSSRRFALCISAVYAALRSIDGIEYYHFDEDHGFDEEFAHNFETTIENDAQLAAIILKTLISLPNPIPLTALLAIRYMARFSKNQDIPEDLPEVSQFPVACALRNLQVIKTPLTEDERWLLRYHQKPPLEFLEALNRVVASGSTEFELFIPKKPQERLSICALRAALRILTSKKECDSSVLDFVVCGLLTTFDHCDSALANIEALRAASQLTITNVSLGLRLWVAAVDFAKNSATEDFRKEWQELFYPTISGIILRFFVDLVDPEDPEACPFLLPLCRAVWSIAELNFDQEFRFIPHYLPQYDAFKYSGVEQAFIEQCAQLIKSKNHYAQFAAHHLMSMYSWKMYRQENGDYAEESGETLKVDGEKARQPPIAFREIVLASHSLPSCLALDACVRIFPLFPTHSERVVYCDGMVPLILHALPVVVSLASQQTPRTNPASYFATEPPKEAADTICRFACSLLYRLVEQVPALVRMWYNKLDRAPSISVNKFFRENLSKLGIDAELTKVREGVPSIDNTENTLKIRTLPAAGEVVTEYTVEETTMRLVIVLPSDWPLHVPQVTLDKSVAASERTKKWLLQLTTYLFHQNGSMLDGLVSWKKQVDKEVAGAEACTICMMSVHASSHQLPRVKCKQCKNKFHSNCLFKWFESSNQSTCPLCRSTFT